MKQSLRRYKLIRQIYTEYRNADANRKHISYFSKKLARNYFQLKFCMKFHMQIDFFIGISVKISKNKVQSVD